MRLTLRFNDGAGGAEVQYLGTGGGRCVYRWALLDGRRIVADGEDLFSGTGADLDLPAMLATLAGFVGAYAEALAYGPDSANYSLFPPDAAEWVKEYADELSTLTDGWED